MISQLVPHFLTHPCPKLPHSSLPLLTSLDIDKPSGFGCACTCIPMLLQDIIALALVLL